MLLQAGATLVVGHSAHVFQGMAPQVLFDLGDFIDDYAVDPELRNDLGLLFLVELDEHGPGRIEAVPIALEYCHTRLARPAEYRWIRERLARACAEFGTKVTDEGRLPPYGRAATRPARGTRAEEAAGRRPGLREHIMTGSARIRGPNTEPVPVVPLSRSRSRASSSAETRGPQLFWAARARASGRRNRSPCPCSWSSIRCRATTSPRRGARDLAAVFHALPGSCPFTAHGPEASRQRCSRVNDH